MFLPLQVVLKGDPKKLNLHGVRTKFVFSFKLLTQDNFI